MNSKARVQAALAFQETETVPYDFEFVDGIMDPLRARLGLPDADAVYRHLGNHVFRFAVGGQARAGSAREVTDEFGVVWNRDKAHQAIGAWGGIVRHALDVPSLDGYSFPDPHRSALFAGVAELVAAHADQFAIAEAPGMLEAGWAIRGFEPLLIDLIERPAFVEALFDGILEYDLGLVAELSRFELDGIWCGDDWSHQHGLFMPPDVWRRVWKPRLRRLYSAIRAKGLAVVVHCCGNCVEVIPDLIELGASLLNPLQPEAMDVEWVKREYGRDLAFYGGMGVQDVLPRGTPANVRRVAQRGIRVLSRGGGLVFGPGSSVTADTPLENALALIDVMTNQGAWR